MGFFDKYPNTDFHEINMDWILAKIQALKDRVKVVEDAIHDIVVVTPNNGKLTIKRNNTIIGDFTADQATDEDINIAVPENTSDLNNDSDFITLSDLPDMDNYYDKTETDALLADKADVSSLATVATTGDYDDLINTPTIPAAQVNSDWSAVSGVAQILNKPTPVYSGDWYYYPLGNNWYLLFGKKEHLSKNFGIGVGSLYYTTAEDTFTLPFTVDNLFGINATINGGGSIFGAWVASYSTTMVKVSYWASQNINANNMASHISCLAHKV